MYIVKYKDKETVSFYTYICICIPIPTIIISMQYAIKL